LKTIQPSRAVCGTICRPARGVSGDYYDLLALGGGKLGLLLADVFGKGISAALMKYGITCGNSGKWTILL
jgi:serine phosphatase RsbU (regulator of sigma subunit)